MEKNKNNVATDPWSANVAAGLPFRNYERPHGNAALQRDGNERPHSNAAATWRAIAVVAAAIIIGTVTNSAFASATWTETEKSDWSGGLTSKTTWYPETQLQLDTTAYWFNPDWKYRRKVTINSSTDTLNDYQVFVATTEFGSDWSDIQSKAQSDMSDFRFVHSSGGALNYWIEPDTNTPEGFWVKVSTVTGDGNTDIFMYYGNASASAGQNGDDTFLLFDDFEDGIIDSDKWPTTIGTPSESDGQLHTDYESAGDYTFTEGVTSYNITTEKITLIWKMKGTDNHKGVCYSTNGNNVYGGTSPTMMIYLQSSGNSIIADGYDTERSYSALGTSDDLWHTYKMSWNGDNTHYSYVGSSEILQAFTFTPSNWKIGIGNNGSDTTVTQDVEYIRARKYADPEPTIALVGSEEGRYYTSANYKSNVLDSGADDTKIHHSSWTPISLPAGTTIQVYLRGSNTSFSAGDETPTWSQLSNGSNPSLIGRYIQWMSTFTTTSSTTTPRIEDITLTYTSPPPQPTEVSGTVLGVSSITWNWTDNSGGQYQEDGFKIYCATSSTLLKTTAADIETWTRTGLIPNTTYKTYIQPYNTAGSSDSETATAVTLCSPPDSPAWDVHIDSITINWGASSPDNPDDTVYITQLSTASDWTGVIKSSQSLRSATTATVSDLSANTTYYGRVIARNRENVDAITELSPSWKATLCSAPDSPAWDIHIDSITVSWGTAESPANPDDTVYIVELSTASDWTGVIKSSQSLRSATTATVSDLTANTTYYGRVIVRNRENVDAITELSPSWKATLCSPPDSPAWDVHIDSITVSWGTAESPANPDDTVYIAQVSTASDWTGVIKSSQSLRSAATATVSDLTANTTYYGRVVARNRESQDSNPAATTPAWKDTLNIPPSWDNISCDKSTGVWTSDADFTFTAVGGFGEGTVEYYKYRWDTNTTTTDYPNTFSSGDLIKDAQDSDNLHLHLKGYNAEDVANGTYDFGPYYSDRSSPTIPSLVSPEDEYAANLTSLTLDWDNVSDNLSGIENSIIEVSTVSNFGTIYESSYTGTSTGYDTSSLDEDKYWWKVKAEDKAGNETVWSSTRSYIIDLQNPDIPAQSSPADGNYLSDNTPNYSWSSVDDNGNPPSGLEWYEIKVSSTQDMATVVFNSTTTNTDITDDDVKNDGRYWWQVRAKDNAGNNSNYSSTFTYVIDITTPEITDNQAGDNSWRNSTGTLYDVGFYDINITTVYYKIHTSSAEGGNLVKDFTSIDESDYSDTTGSWEVDFSTIPEGFNYVSVRADDLAGNTSSWIDIFYIKKDTTPPEGVSIESVMEVSTYSIKVTAVGTDTISGLTDEPWQFREETGHVGGGGTQNDGGAFDDGTDAYWLSFSTPTDFALVANTSYTYKVKARDIAENESDFSALVTTWTLAAVPIGPYSEAVSTESLNLKVQYDSESNELNTSNDYYDLGLTEYLVNFSTVSEFSPLTYISTNGIVGSEIKWARRKEFNGSPEDGCEVLGLMSNTSYYIRIKARNQSHVETVYGNTVNRTTLIEPPAGLESSEISTDSMKMRGTGSWTNLTISSSGLIIYNRTSGTTDYWHQDNDWWLNTGLSVNTAYEYKINSRNQEAQEYYDYLSDMPSTTVYTLAAVPPAPTVENLSSAEGGVNKLNVVINSGDNPEADETEFAIAVSSYNYSNTIWSESKWVDWVTDELQPELDEGCWKDYSNWGSTDGVNVDGLDANTRYRVSIKARNGDGIETANGEWAERWTRQAEPTDLKYDEIGTDYIKLSAITAKGENALAFNNLGYGDDSTVRFDETDIPYNSGWITNNDWKLGTGGNGDPLIANTTYYFKVQARNGELVYSDIYGEEPKATRIESIGGIEFPTITTTTVLIRPTNVDSLTNLGASQSGWVVKLYDYNKTLISSSSWRQVTECREEVDLSTNAVYYTKANSRNNQGLENTLTDYVTFYTLAAIPQAATLARDQTYPDEIEISISETATNGNPSLDTGYAIKFSSLTDFTTYWWIENTGTSAPGWNKTFKKDSDWNGGTYINTLESNTTYYAKLIARNLEGTETEAGVAASAITPSSPPEITYAEPVAGYETSQIKVEWIGDGSEFRVEKSTCDPHNWQQLEDWSSADKTATEDGIPVNSPRWYQVLSRTSDGFGPAVSGTTVTWTRADLPDWAADPLPDSEITEKEFNIYWSSGSNPAWTEYYLAGSTDDIDYTYYMDWESTTNYNATLLDVNKKYYFKVRARSGDGGVVDHGEKVNTDYTATESKYTRIESAGEAEFKRYVTSATVIGRYYTDIWDDPPTRIDEGVSGINFKNIDTNQGRDETSDDKKINSWPNTDLVANSTYQYKITTYNGDELFNSPYTTKIITTSIEVPTGVGFDTDISTYYIKARPAPTDYTNLGVSSSAWQVECETYGVDPSTSGWRVDSATSYFKFSGLKANNGYDFVAQSRNRSAETNESPTVTKYTLANNASLTVSRIEGSTESLSATITEGDGASNSSDYPEYAICVTTNGWTDTWWLNSDGTGFASNSSQVWANKSNWGDGTDIIVVGLKANTDYSFKVKTRNGDKDYNGDGYSEEKSAYTEIEKPEIIDIISRSTFSVTVEAISKAPDGNFSNLGVGSAKLSFEEFNTSQSQDKISTTSWECNLSSPNVGGSFSVESFNGDALSAGVTEWFDYGSLIEKSTSLIFGTIDTVSIEVKAGNSFSRLTDGESGWIIYNITDSTDTDWKQTAPAYYTFSGLDINTKYNFKTNSRNREGVKNQESQIFNRYTKSNAPAAGVIDEVTENEMTAHWTANSNPSPTEYQAAISTVSDFSVLLDSSVWKVDISSYQFTGLTPNTVYYLQARTRNGDDIESGWTSLGDKCTKIESPTGVDYEIWESSIVVTATGNFTNLTSDGYIQFGKSTDGVTWTNSSDLLTESNDYTGLSANTTYQFRARTKNQSLAIINDWIVGPSSATRIEEPSEAVWGVVSSSAIEVKPANAVNLSNLDDGLSGWMAYSIDTSSYSVWQQSVGYVNFSTGMVANELYNFKLKTRNYDGLENNYGQEYSTYTLCKIPDVNLSKPAEPGAVEVTLLPEGNEDTSQTTIYNIRLSSNPWSSIWYQGVGLSPEIYNTPQDGDYNDFGGGESRKITELVPGTTYWVGARARNEALIWTEWSSAESLITRADKPYNLSTVAPEGTADELDISWSGTGDEFFVQYSTADPGDIGFSTDTWCDLNGGVWIVTKSTKDLTLSPNEERWYHVKARDAELVETDYSDEEPGAYSRALQPGDDNYSSVSASGYKVKWTTGTGGNYNPDYTDYEVQIDTCGLFVWENLIDSTTLRGKNYTTDKLEPNGPYYARLKAVNKDGLNTGWTDITNFDNTNKYIYTRIESPEYVGLEIYKSSVTLNAPGRYSRSAGETSFTLYITTPGGTVEDSGWQTSNDWESSDILTENTTYQFNIKTRNYENLENSVVFTTAATRIEDADSVVIKEITPYSLKIRSSGTYRDINEGRSGVRILNETTGSSSTWSNTDNGNYWWKDINLDPSEEYRYKVKTRNREGLENSWKVLRDTSTLSLTAGITQVESLSSETIKVVIGRGGNLSETVRYLIGVSTDAKKLPDSYVQSDGSTATVRYWDSFPNWGGADGQVVKDLGINKDYYLRVKAQNADGIEGVWSEVKTADTLSRWHFGDGGLDETSSAYHLTYSTGAAEINGRMGEGLDVDGNFGYGWSSDTIKAEYSAMTVEAWVKADSLESLDRIIDNGDSNNIDSGKTFSLHIFTDGATPRIVYRSNGGINYYATADQEISTGTWTHLAGVYDGTHVLLYVNGQLQTSSSTLTGNLNDVDNPVTIGAWSDGPAGNASNFFDGIIDEVNIYDKALSEGELKAHYQGSKIATKIEEPVGIDFVVESSTYIKVKSSNEYTRLSQESSGINIYNTITTTGTGFKKDNNWWEDDDFSSGLLPNTTYIYELQARNRDGSTTGTIDNSTVTLAAVPGKATLSDESTSTIKIVIDEGDNPATENTEYVIGISSFDATVPTYYVQSDSTTASSEFWQTYNGWGGALGIVVKGLEANTTYYVKLKARNHQEIETDYSDINSLATDIEQARSSSGTFAPCLSEIKCICA